VEVAFGLPGVHMQPAWSALREERGLRVVGVRHEQAAGYAADGYARAGGRLGVALVTTGPGAANTLAAVGEAFASGSPVLVVASDIPAALRQPNVFRGVLHETRDQAGMFAPVVKATARVERPEELEEAVVAAGRHALQAPARPVYLEVPTDVLSGTLAAGPAPDGWSLAAEPVPEVPEADLDAAAALLARAERPLVWAGGGALRSGAGPQVAALAERLGAPVILTFGARGLLPPDHPCLVAFPPHEPAVGRLWDEADAVVAIGSDFDGMTTQNWAQPAPPALVAVNVEPVDAAKGYLPDLVLAGDAAAVTGRLAERLAPRDRLPDLAALREEVRARLAAEEPEALAFLDAVARHAPPEATLVCDMCIPGYWLGGYHAPAAPGRLTYPVGWGTLGAAFPQALGAALGSPGGAISISGDGGFLYACGELATAAQERLPLTAVVVDDGGYGMLRFDQARAGAPPFGVDLRSPDFVALSEAFGVRAEAVDGLGDAFGRALARHAADPEPTLLLARAALRPPPTTSPRWYRLGRG
jgi:acetolactate synthase-1/2/3 large subunit